MDNFLNIITYPEKFTVSTVTKPYKSRPCSSRMPVLGSGSLPAWRAGFRKDMQVRFLPPAFAGIRDAEILSPEHPYRTPEVFKYPNSMKKHGIQGHCAQAIRGQKV